MSPLRANVVLAIVVVGLLIGLVIPRVQQSRRKAALEETKNRLRVLAVALHDCNDVYKRLPPAYDQFAAIKYPVSLHVHLLPFINQKDVYDSYLQEGQGKENALVEHYLAPADQSISATAGVQNYAANLRIFSHKLRAIRYNKDAEDLQGSHSCPIGLGNGFPDGTSNTIMLGTKYAACGQGGSRYAAAPASPYAAFFGDRAAREPPHPTNPRATFQLAPSLSECLPSPLRVQSFSDEGTPVAMADTVVRFVSPTMDPVMWNRAMHPADEFRD